MKDLKINRTTDTPLVTFCNNGSLSVEGKAYNEDPMKFFMPLIEWCRDITIETVTFEIRLEYLNTASAKMMVEMIRTIDANSKIRKKEIQWYFEEDDEDMLETGQIIEESIFSIDFTYFKLAEVFN